MRAFTIYVWLPGEPPSADGAFYVLGPNGPVGKALTKEDVLALKVEEGERLKDEFVIVWVAVLGGAMLAQSRAELERLLAAALSLGLPFPPDPDEDPDVAETVSPKP